MLGGTPKQLEAFLDKFDVLVKESFPDNGGEFMFQTVIGSILARKRHDKHSLSNNFVRWSVDEYVAKALGPMGDKYLALHQFLVKSGATSSNKFDFQHCDRYGTAYADEKDFKTMAIMTQNYTYMVMLCKRTVWGELDDQAGNSVWAIHIRVCVPSKHGSTDYTRAEFDALDWLNDREKCSPSIGYGQKTQDYFRYKDGRDRGYCISIEPDFIAHDGVPTYTAKDAMWNYGMLEGIVYDLACHYSCIRGYEKY